MNGFYYLVIQLSISSNITLLILILIATLDLYGRETSNKEGFQLHIYDDGSVEKKYLIK